MGEAQKTKFLIVFKSCIINFPTKKLMVVELLVVVQANLNAFSSN